MADHAVANRHIRDRASRADVELPNRLIFWGQQDREALLRETTPAILQNVCLEQNAHPTLQFEEILDDKRIAIAAADKAGLSSHPGHRLEQVVASDLDVCWGRSRSTTAEQN